MTAGENGMNIGIVVYSQTGNTLMVCEDIKKGLEKASHAVTIEQVKVAEGQRHAPDAELTSSPNPQGYDALIFASPVQGFSLARPMQKYLKTQRGLGGRKTALVLTKGLPFNWTGGTRALTVMQQLSESAGAEIIPEVIIIRAGANASTASDAAVKQLLGYF